MVSHYSWNIPIREEINRHTNYQHHVKVISKSVSRQGQDVLHVSKSVFLWWCSQLLPQRTLRAMLCVGVKYWKKAHLLCMVVQVTNVVTRRQRMQVYQLPFSPRTMDNMVTASRKLNCMFQKDRNHMFQ